MSSTLKTKNRGELNDCGFYSLFTDTISIGPYIIETEEFVNFAAHIMGGGVFGWSNGDIPKYVQDAVERINYRMKHQPTKDLEEMLNNVPYRRNKSRRK